MGVPRSNISTCSALPPQRAYRSQHTKHGGLLVLVKTPWPIVENRDVPSLISVSSRYSIPFHVIIDYQIRTYSLFGPRHKTSSTLRNRQAMASRIRPPRVSLANLRPAPGSQQNVGTFFSSLETLIQFTVSSKSELAGAKVRDTEGQRVVVRMDRSLVRDQALDQALRVARPQSPNS